MPRLRVRKYFLIKPTGVNDGQYLASIFSS